jgi:hypothetical protein
MYAETPWLERSGLSERPTTAMVFDFLKSSVIGSKSGTDAME